MSNIQTVLSLSLVCGTNIPTGEDEGSPGLTRKSQKTAFPLFGQVRKD